MSDIDRYLSLFRSLLILASIATLCVALWLIAVITLVLPARDPAHIPIWRAIAGGYLVYCAISWRYLFQGERSAILRWGVLPLSGIAVALAIYGIVSAISIAGHGGHFEGYIVLMGILLAGHGVTQLIHAILAMRIARRVRAS